MLPFMPARFGALAALSPQPGGPTAVTWNPSDKSSNLTLSNGNLTAVSADGQPAGVRSTTSHTTGKFYWEVTVDKDDGSTSGYAACVTVLTGSSSMTSADGNNAEYFNHVGDVYVAGSHVFFFGSPPISSVGNVLQIAADIGNRLMWVRGNLETLWNDNFNSGGGADPTTGAGGQPLPATVPLFAGCQLNAGSGSAQLTANFGATSYVNSPPSGYGNW